MELKLSHQNRLEENLCSSVELRLTALRWKTALDQVANLKQVKLYWIIFSVPFAGELDKAEKIRRERGMRAERMVLTSVTADL